MELLVHVIPQLGLAAALPPRPARRSAPVSPPVMRIGSNSRLTSPCSEHVNKTRTVTRFLYARGGGERRGRHEHGAARPSAESGTRCLPARSQNKPRKRRGCKQPPYRGSSHRSSPSFTLTSSVVKGKKQRGAGLGEAPLTAGSFLRVSPLGLRRGRRGALLGQADLPRAPPAAGGSGPAPGRQLRPPRAISLPEERR